VNLRDENLVLLERESRHSRNSFSAGQKSASGYVILPLRVISTVKLVQKSRKRKRQLV